MIDDSNKYLIGASDEKQITEILSWVVSSVEQCFISQHDKDDFYEIKNYDPELEIRWNNYWKKQLLSHLS